MSKPDPQTEMATALMQVVALFTPLGEAVDGYRADLERRNYSPTAAEHMAMEFHHYLIQSLMAGIK